MLKGLAVFHYKGHFKATWIVSDKRIERDFEDYDDFYLWTLMCFEEIRIASKDSQMACNILSHVLENYKPVPQVVIDAFKNDPAW